MQIGKKRNANIIKIILLYNSIDTCPVQKQDKSINVFTKISYNLNLQFDVYQIIKCLITNKQTLIADMNRNQAVVNVSSQSILSVFQ